MKPEILLSALHYYFFSGYNINSELLLSILCVIKKKTFSGYNMKNEILFSILCSEEKHFLHITSKVKYY